MKSLQTETLVYGFVTKSLQVVGFVTVAGLLEIGMGLACNISR